MEKTKVGSPLCPMGQQEQKPIIYFVVKCKKLHDMHNQKVKELQYIIYIAKNLRLPVVPEIRSAILNGRCYMLEEGSQHTQHHHHSLVPAYVPIKGFLSQLIYCPFFFVAQTYHNQRHVTSPIGEGSSPGQEVGSK